MKLGLKRMVSGIVAGIMLLSQACTVNATLLPIEEMSASIDLSEALPGELRCMNVSDVLSQMVDKDKNHIKFEKDVKAVWSRFTGDSGDFEYDVWKVTDIDSTIDLMPVFYNSSARLELIVGSANQLDPNNVRYLLDIKGPELKDIFNLDLYWQGEVSFGDGTTKTVRNKVDFTSSYDKRKFLNEDGGTDIQSNLRFSVAPDYNEDSYYFAHMTLKKENYPDAEMRVYDGRFSSAEAAAAAAQKNPAVDVTDKLAAGDMSLIDAGLGSRYSDEKERRMLTTVYKRNGETVGFDYFYLTVDPRDNNVVYNDMYSIDDKGNAVPVEGSNTTYFDKYGVKVIKYDVAPENPADRDYYFSFSFYDGNENKYNNEKVVKAVEGQYASIQAANAQPDIKDTLFADPHSEGFRADKVYKGNYSGQGKNFTVFSGKDGKEVWKFKVLAEDIVEEEEVVEYEEPPIVDSDDKYFSVKELYGDGRIDTYTIPYDQDTYYSLGYQTLLVNDTNQSLKSLSLEARLGYHAKVYKDGKVEDTGDEEDSTYVTAILSPADFTREQTDTGINPDGSVRYTVSAENHIDHKNYWITVAKKAKGSKLFVNGPDKREIFINNYYGNAHDIFIANIGTEELTGINVSLDSKNIALDEYWTIGGEGNDTLAPFNSTVNDASGRYGELPNVAKIRLLAKGEGELSGVLTITADGQEPRVINITGKAGNPKIDTTSLHNGVLYVPYSSVITTNNMHDWNRVTFSLDSGSLPEGMELFPSGEIYGVPKETGEFKIRVKADFSSSQFEPSYAELTLNILDNTDENVAAQVDEGFEIIRRIPDITLEEGEIPEPQLFEFEYDYAEHREEFQGLWLNGTKLVKGVDYTVAPGSTAINLAGQVQSSMPKGKNTIAAEYRTPQKDLKKSTQNFNKNTGTNTAAAVKTTRAATVQTTTEPTSSASKASTAPVKSQKTTSARKKTVYYTVTFVSNGGADVEPAEVQEGKYVYLCTPERPGYRLEGWYTDEELTEKFDGRPIKSEITLYAKWERVNCHVWFNSNGGSEKDSAEVLGDTSMDILPEPKKIGYTFEGWYTTPEFEEQFYKDDKVYTNMVLYAKWDEIPVPPVPPENAADFADIDKTLWYYKDVDWAYGSGILEGYNNAVFGPDESFTMGSFVKAMAILSGEDLSKFDTVEYPGIENGKWYSSYAKWAYERVMKPQAVFDPDAPVTREDAAVMIVKYLKYMNAGYGAAQGDVEFSDGDEISPEAMEAVQILYKNGIISGKGNNTIKPKDVISKAEFASLIHRVNYFIYNKRK